MPGTHGYVAGITEGPTGDIWFTEAQSGTLGLVTPSGMLSLYRVPGDCSVPSGITGGPAGQVWFTEQIRGNVGELQPIGKNAVPIAKRYRRDTASPDSCWHVEPPEVGRLALVHERDEGAQALRALPPDEVLLPPARFYGGGGLICTLGDYYRFAEFLRRRGGLDGTRVLSPRTVDFMTANHIPDGTDILHFGKTFDPVDQSRGLGYGLGVGVRVGPVAAEVPWSAGSYWWSGAFNTQFWVDPLLDITVHPGRSHNPGRSSTLSQSPPLSHPTTYTSRTTRFQHDVLPYTRPGGGRREVRLVAWMMGAESVAYPGGRCWSAAYEASGCHVIGTATSGQAARTLGKEADIGESRTLASLVWRLDHGRFTLDERTVATPVPTTTKAQVMRHDRPRVITQPPVVQHEPSDADREACEPPCLWRRSSLPGLR